MQLLAGLGPLGVPELLIIAFVVVLIFGVGRLPEVGGAVGKGIREFRKATKDDDAPPPMAASDDMAPGAGVVSSETPTSSAGDTVFCSECGTKNARGAKFCAQCGHAIGAPVS
jgi:sec-independent protein translocase protein TatA